MQLNKYIKTLTTLSLFIVCFGIAYAQKEPKAKKTKAAPANKKTPKSMVDNNSLLWEITGNGISTPSYVFGTLHILCADDANLSDSLKTVIKETGQIFFEIDMDNMQEMMGALKFLRMNDGKKISDLLTAEEYDKVRAYFDQNRSAMPFTMMNRFKPFFVSSMIGESMMGCEKVNGMEMQIMKEAKQYKKEIRGLESIEFQASIFDSIPYEHQAKELVKYVDSIESYRKVMAEMVEVYRTQNLTKMEELMVKSDPGLEGYMDLLLYKRNHNWIGSMQEQMKEVSTLFAVGAGHLPGKEGVLQLLRDKGYKVRPVKS